MKKLIFGLLLTLSSLAAIAQSLSWDPIVPIGYNPGVRVDWADNIETMTLPSSKVWVTERGIWPAATVYDKGVTHLSNYALDGLTTAEIIGYRDAGKSYNAVPQTAYQFGLNPGNSPRTQHAPGSPNTWPYTWDGDYWGTPEGVSEPMTYQQGYDRGQNIDVDHALVIFENGEQRHAISSHWPFRKAFYESYMPRGTARFAAIGKPFLVADNYFSGITGTMQWMSQQNAKLLPSLPFSQWTLPEFSFKGGDMLPGHNLEKTTLSCFGLYLSTPDESRNTMYNIVYSALLNRKAGKYMVGFMQSSHEWRPNNLLSVKYPEGTIYYYNKQPVSNSEIMMSTALCFVFADGMLGFGFGGKTDNLKLDRNNNYAFENALWYPNGATSPQSLDSFPHWGNGGFTKPGTVENLQALTVRAYARNFGQTVGGTGRYLDYQIDNGPWINAENVEANDIVNAQFGKRAIVYSVTKNNITSILYINPFADNKKHTLKFREPVNNVEYTTTVATGNPHFSRIVR